MMASAVLERFSSLDETLSTIKEALAQRNMDDTVQCVMETLMKVEEQVAFYERRIVRLLAAVKAINDDFDRGMIGRYHTELEIIRDKLSRILDKAEGKLK